MNSHLVAACHISAASLVSGAIVCALLSGCTTDPDTGDVTIRVPARAVNFATNAVREYLEGLDEAAMGSAQADSSGAAESGPPATAEGEAATSQPREEPESVALLLNYRYGGFNGGGAKEDSRCRISNFKMGKSGCSLKWETSIPGDWARDKDGLIVAAIFYKDGGGRWIGGKFDWIDRSRSTRDFKNIDGGYGGWSASAFRSAKKHGFCVVSADGKWRSNFIED